MRWPEPEQWCLGANDPTFMGWTVTFCYLLASVTCALACLNVLHGSGKARICWITLAACLIALSLNKQLDLQNLLRIVVVENAGVHPWYPELRSTYAYAVIGTLAGLAVLVPAVVHRFLRPTGMLAVALYTFGALLITLLLQNIPVEEISTLMGTTFFESMPGIWRFDVAELFEFGSVIIIALCAMSARPNPSERPSRHEVSLAPACQLGE